MNKFVIVCGGGSVARTYENVLEAERRNEKEVSIAGIRATRMNAEFMMQVFGKKEANDILPTTLKQVKSDLAKNKVVVCRDKGCLTEDIKKIYEENRKKQQDLKAKAEFGSLIQFLQSCTGTCGKRTFTEGYNAYYVSSGFASKDRWPFEHGIYLTIDKSEPEEKDAIISGKINYIKLLLYSKDKELDTGYLFKNNEADFFFSRDKIIVG